MGEVTNLDTNELARGLNKLKPGLLPKEVFYSIARLVVTPTYVVVAIYVDKDATYIHLTRRPPEDPDFPGMLHPIGKIILASDVSLKETFERLWSKEIHSASIKEGPVFVSNVFDKIPRGKEVSLIHWVLLSEKPAIGELYNIDLLPENEIPATDVNRIRMALEHFSKNRTQ